MNVYFFGGSFDPPHLGHLKIIETCFDRFDITRFILIPANQSPLKKNKPIASQIHRIEMLKLLIDNFDNKITIDDWEISRSGPSYTYDTIEYLIEKYPGCCFFMILGYDQFVSFKNWKNYKKILNSVKIIVFNRSDENFTLIRGVDIMKIENFQFNISSENIRKKINNGKLLISDLPLKVNNYINEHGLYKINDI